MPRHVRRRSSPASARPSRQSLRRSRCPNSGWPPQPRAAGRSRSHRRRNAARDNRRPNLRAGPGARGSSARLSRAARARPSLRACARRLADIRPRPSPRAAGSASGRRGSAARRPMPSASAIRSARVRRTSSCSARPSIGWNPGTIPASAGNAASRPCAKLWMVWILSPPGQSSTRANNCRAFSSVFGSFGSPRFRRSAASSDFLRRTQAGEPRRPMRLAISAAAALVKVRQRIGFGSDVMQQQPQYASCQDMGLPGAGRGG